MKKRYWLFHLVDYENSGGMNDFVKDFDSIEELTDSKEHLDLIGDIIKGYCSIEIYDLHKDLIIKLPSPERP